MPLVALQEVGEGSLGALVDQETKKAAARDQTGEEGVFHLVVNKTGYSCFFAYAGLFFLCCLAITNSCALPVCQFFLLSANVCA